MRASPGNGQFVNGKRTGRVNQLQTNYDLLNYRVTFSERNSNSENIFHLIEDKKKIESYLSGFFNEKINFLQNQEADNEVETTKKQDRE